MSQTRAIDFTGCPYGWRHYDGSERKDSIIYDGTPYMIKFADKKATVNDLQTSNVNNVFSEYLGSHIVASLGMPVHETLLGTRRVAGREEIVVACRDFCEGGFELHHFSWFMLNMYDKSEIKRIPTYRQLYDVIENNPKLAPIREAAIQRYWETFVADALIGNFDRHKENFGYLVNPATGAIKLAPVYDCGSCLYPMASLDVMREILADPDKIEQRMCAFPKAALNMADDPRREEKAGYFETLSSKADANCEAAFRAVYPRIDMAKLNAIVDAAPLVPDGKKEFYKRMLAYRKSLILDKAMEKLGAKLL